MLAACCQGSSFPLDRSTFTWRLRPPMHTLTTVDSCQNQQTSSAIECCPAMLFEQLVGWQSRWVNKLTRMTPSANRPNVFLPFEVYHIPSLLNSTEPVPRPDLQHGMPDAARHPTFGFLSRQQLTEWFSLGTPEHRHFVPEHGQNMLDADSPWRPNL